MSTVSTLATRRAMLRGTAALAVLAAPPDPALVSPAAGDQPDAALLALGREWNAACAAYDAVDALCSAAEEEQDRREPPIPNAVHYREGDRELGMPEASRTHDGRLWYWRETVDRLRTLRPGRAVARPVTPADNLPADAHTYVAWVPVPEERARAEEIVAAWDGWRAEVDALVAALGLPELDARLKEAGSRRNAIEARIATVPATTLAGLVLKARVALWITGEADMPDPAEMEHACAVELFGASIMRNLLALDRREA